MTLPGQIINSNGISNFAFGSQMPPDYGPFPGTPSPFWNGGSSSSALQAQVKTAGITIIRMPMSNGSQSYTNAQITQRVNAIRNAGAVPLIILGFTCGWTQNAHIVTLIKAMGSGLPTIFEVYNEPDLNSSIAGPTKYITDWLTNVPAMRTIWPQAAFIGPALGVSGLSSSGGNWDTWVKPWLQACISDGRASVLPDGVSTHIYPCGSQPSQTVCSTKAQDVGVGAANLRTAIAGWFPGHSFPICVTEWNIDYNTPVVSYAVQTNSANQPFIYNWYMAALKSLVDNKIDMACQFELCGNAENGEADLIRMSTLQNQYSWQPMVDSIKLYLGGGGGTGGGTASGTLDKTTLALSSTQGSTTPVSGNVRITNSGTTAGTFTTSITYVNGSNWLSLDTTTATLNPTQGITLTVTANPTAFPAGSYQAKVIFTLGSSVLTLTVTLSITGSSTGVNAGNPYCVTVGASGANAVLNPQLIVDMLALGMTWLRYQISWGNIDPAAVTNTSSQVPTSYVWNAWDDAVQKCNAAGINIVLTIFQGFNSSNFANQFMDSAHNQPLLPTPTAKFAQQIAQRYNPNGSGHNGLKVQAIEVGNEDYDNTSQTPAAPLVATLKAVYPAVKAVNSAIVVGSACLLQRNESHYTAFMETLLNPSSGAYSGSTFQADYLNLHFYTGIPTSGGAPVSLDPTVEIPSWNGGAGLPSIDKAWQLIHAKAQQYGVALPLWVTETGWQTNTNPGRNAAATVDQAHQWSYLKAILDSCRTSNYVTKVFIFTLGYFDQYAGTGINVRDGMSLVQGPVGSPTYLTAYTNLQTYAKTTYPQWGTSGGGTPPTLVAKNIGTRLVLTAASGTGDTGTSGLGGTSVSVSAPLPTALGVSYFAESMGYITRSDAQIQTDLTQIKKVANKLKVYCNPLTTNVGGVSHAAGVALCTKIIQKAKALGMHTVWAPIVDTPPTGFTFNDVNWPTYVKAIVADATNARLAGADEYLVGVEVLGSATANPMGKDTSTDPGYSAANFPSRISALVDACRANFPSPGLIGYQDDYSQASMWGVGIGGLLHLDKIYFDFFTPWNVVQAVVPQLSSTFGSRCEIGELTTSDRLGSLNFYATYSEDEYARDLLRRYDLLRQTGMGASLFLYANDNHFFGGFEIRQTASNDTTYHDVWNYLTGSKTLAYNRYFYDTFPSGSGNQDFTGDGTNNNGEMDCTANNAGSFATIPGGGTNYVFRGSVKLVAGAGSVRLVTRYVDTNNYYCLDLKVSTNTISLIRRQAGVETTLKSISNPQTAYATAGLAFNVIYDFELRVNGTGNQTHLVVFFDSYKVYDAVDVASTLFPTSQFGCKNNGASCALSRVTASDLEVIGTGTGSSSGGGGGGGGTPMVTALPFGLIRIGQSRYGDDVPTSVRPVSQALGLSYNVSTSKYVLPFTLGYTIQKAQTSPLFLYYTIVPPSQFAINGDGSIVNPDHLTYTVVPVTGRTLLGSPQLQGYKSMTWTWTVLRPQEYQHILSFYDPNNPVVLLTYPDESGTWVQRNAVIRPPPQYGERQTMVVNNFSLTFTRL